MIESLTEEQKELFPKYIKKWLDIGLSTTPTNKKRATELIHDCYKIAGLDAPKFVIFCGSPLSAILTAKITNQILTDKNLMEKVIKEVSRKKKTNSIAVGASVWDSVGASVRDSVRASVWDSVGASVRDSVRASVWASVWDSVGGSVWDSVRDSVWDSVGGSVGASVYSECAWNQHDAGWYGFCEYFCEVLNLSKQVEKQIPLMRLAEEANWMYPYENFCFVSEKPEICKLENGVIHSEIGPAIKYKDGFSVYALSGIRMNGNEWVCEAPAEKLDVEKVMAIKNVEQRLMAIKKVGIARILSKLDSKVISEGTLDESGLHYRLHAVVLEGESQRLFELPNPSENKKHFEFVDPGCETIFEADLWRRGYDEYKTMKYEKTGLRA